MIRRLLEIATLGVLLSGCYMVPMALIGPATSGFLKQAYFPKKNQTKLIKPGLKSIQVHKD